MPIFTQQFSSVVPPSAVTMAMVDEVVIDWTAETPSTITSTYVDTVTGQTWTFSSSGSNMGTLAMTISAANGLMITGLGSQNDRYLQMSASIANMINAITDGDPFNPETDLLEIIQHMEVDLTTWAYGFVDLTADGFIGSTAGRWNFNNTQSTRVTPPGGAVVSATQAGNEFIMGARISKGRWSWLSDFVTVNPDSAWEDLSLHVAAGETFTYTNHTGLWDNPEWSLALGGVGHTFGAMTVKFYKTTIRRLRAVVV